MCDTKHFLILIKINNGQQNIHLLIFIIILIKNIKIVVVFFTFNTNN